MLIDITEEERNAAIIQIGARIDYFENQLMHPESPERVIEIVNAIKPLKSFKNKLITAKLKPIIPK